MRLTDETYWNAGYETLHLAEAKGGYLEAFLDDYVEKKDDATCMEIGSFPGSYLPLIGRKGYRLYGIDFNKRNSCDLPEWLRESGLPVGEFWSDDFFDFIKNHSVQYDLVCSFGFVEHFENFREVIAMHAQLVKPGGQIIITTPNFRGWMQYLPHKIFDYENLKKHNLKSMNPPEWSKILRSEGFEVRFQGYFGKYYFWVDENEKRSRTKLFFLRNVNRLIFNLNKLIKRTGRESKKYSAFCGIVALKNK